MFFAADSLTVSIVKVIEWMMSMLERRRKLAARVKAATGSGLRRSDYDRHEGLSVLALHPYRKRERQRARPDGASVRVASVAERVAAGPIRTGPVQVQFPKVVSDVPRKMSHIAVLDQGINEASANGWRPGSMKDDWKQVFE